MKEQANHTEFVIETMLPNGINWFKGFRKENINGNAVVFNEWSPYYWHRLLMDADQAKAYLKQINLSGATIVPLKEANANKTGIVHHYGEYAYLSHPIRCSRVKKGMYISMGQNQPIKKVMAVENGRVYAANIKPHITCTGEDTIQSNGYVEDSFSRKSDQWIRRVFIDEKTKIK